MHGSSKTCGSGECRLQPEGFAGCKEEDKYVNREHDACDGNGRGT